MQDRMRHLPRSFDVYHSMGAGRTMWMITNSEVAVLPVRFGSLFLKSKRISLRVLLGLLWILFLPNTSYLFAGLEHFPAQWHSVNGLQHFDLILEYIAVELFALLTFLLAFLPFKRVIKRLSHGEQVLAIILFNFLIAFGTALGKWKHVNSWVVFTDPIKVALSAVQILTSFSLFELVILFCVICNVIYFLFRRILLRHAHLLWQNP